MRRPALRRRFGAALLALLVGMGLAAVSCASGGRTRTAPSTFQRAPRGSVSTTVAPSTTPVPTSTSTAPTTVPLPSTTRAASPAVTAPGTAPPPATAAPTPPAATAPPPAPSGRLIDQLADTGGATKVITVRSASWSSTTAELMGWERRPTGWALVHGPWTANVGYRGWSWRPGEANGYSPVGSFTFGTGFGTGANPGYALGWFAIGPHDYWVEDPAFSTYNTHQVWLGAEGTEPWGHDERLADYPVAYHYAALIDFNVPPTDTRSGADGRGSGIFLHVSQGGDTAGCVALPEPQLLALLRWIDGGTRIIMGPDDTLRSL